MSETDGTVPYMLSPAEIMAFRSPQTARAARQEQIRASPLLAALNVVLMWDLTTQVPLASLPVQGQAEYRRSLRHKLRLAYTLLAVSGITATLLASGYVGHAAEAGVGAFDSNVDACLQISSADAARGGGAVPALALWLGATRMQAAVIGMALIQLAVLGIFVGIMAAGDAHMLVMHLPFGLAVRPMLIAPWASWSLTEFWVSGDYQRGR